MVVDMKRNLAEVQAWKRDVFEPWKARMEEYQAQKAQELDRLRANAAQLETIVGLLIDGRTRQAMLAWNALELHPKLRDLRISGDAETLTLVDDAGKVSVLKLDTLIAELAQMLDEKSDPMRRESGGQGAGPSM